VAKSPIITIAFPVYNGERFMRESLDALLAQDLTDFELVINDNASTDGTQAIAEELCARDSRIRYNRQPENLGARDNFEQVVWTARGKYFIWASCHDLWAPSLLRRCVETMEQDDSVALCFSRAAEIDADGNRLGTLRGKLDTRGMDRIARFKKTMLRVAGYAVYGVHRTAVLRRVMPLEIMFGPDIKLMAELSFHGAFAYLPEELFFHRRLSVSRNWRRYFSNLKMTYHWWRMFELFADMVCTHLAMIRQYTDKPSQRVHLSAWSVLIQLKRTAAWGVALVTSLFFRRYYRPW